MKKLLPIFSFFVLIGFSVNSQTIPTVSVTGFTMTSSTSVSIPCIVSSDGGATVTARGVCYGITSNPTVTGNSHTSNGTGTGAFTSDITDLAPVTTFYFRPYATNSVGTAYGNQTIVTMPPAGPPIVTTAAVTSIAQTTATGGGNVTSANGSAITARGVCWNTSTNPTIANNKCSNGTAVGTYSCQITGLIPGTLYYVRAYATNSLGTSYGSVVTFTSVAADWIGIGNNINYTFGNVGINNPAPAFKLDVTGDIHTNSMLIMSALGMAQMRLNSSGTYYGKIGNPSAQIWSLGYGTTGTDITPVLNWTATGNVLIGKTSQTNATYKLDVNGIIRANEIVVNSDGADYVFEKDYNLRSLTELNKYIIANKHLPDIQSAKEMQDEGVNMGDLQIQLLQKIEELTLYIIDLKKENDSQKMQIDLLLKKTSIQ